VPSPDQPECRRARLPIQVLLELGVLLCKVSLAKIIQRIEVIDHFLFEHFIEDDAEVFGVLVTERCLLYSVAIDGGAERLREILVGELGALSLAEAVDQRGQQ
jgi:hypothetical protein